MPAKAPIKKPLTKKQPAKPAQKIETPAQEIETPAEPKPGPAPEVPAENFPMEAEPQALVTAPAPPEPEMPREEPPGQPLNLSVEVVNDSSVSLKWKAPENAGAAGQEGYLLEYTKEGTDQWITVNPEPVHTTHYTIQGLTTGDKIIVRVKATNRAGVSNPVVLDHPIQIREITGRPKIRLPRHLRETLVCVGGDAINLLIPFQGKPKPQVSWSKNGQLLDPKQVSIRNSDKDTILFIRKAERKDSGKYEVTVQIDSLQDKAIFEIQVIEKPGTPQGIKLVDVWGFNVALEWIPPKDDGNSDIRGYTVQKSDKKTGVWFTVLEHCHRTDCTVSDLIVGNSYYFRVYTENLCGLSEKAAETKACALIKKTGIVYKPLEFPEHDFSEAPKFTHALNDRTTTTGYSTKLFCSVRGTPKPKIVWMKNQMEIREDPKYRALTNQGVCSLEIRKPCPFDGGVYTCKAINSLGEASVDCRLDVKVPQ